jgi:hypothetical protein
MKTKNKHIFKQSVHYCSPISIKLVQINDSNTTLKIFINMCTAMLEFLQMGRVMAAFLQHLTATAPKLLHQ